MWQQIWKMSCFDRYQLFLVLWKRSWLLSRSSSSIYSWRSRYRLELNLFFLDRTRSRFCRARLAASWTNFVLRSSTSSSTSSKTSRSTPTRSSGSAWSSSSRRLNFFDLVFRVVVVAQLVVLWSEHSHISVGRGSNATTSSSFFVIHFLAQSMHIKLALPQAACQSIFISCVAPPRRTWSKDTLLKG